MTWRRPRSVHTSVVTALFAVGAAGAGCGNDFDALFTNQTPPGPFDASGGDAKPSSDASSELDAALACGAPTACTPGTTCLDKTCTNDCGGCGCSCPTFACDEDVDRCITTCSDGTTCTVTCSAEKECTLVAHGAVATLTCAADNDRCSLVCDQGASCDLACDRDRRGGRCIAVCDSTSSCVVDCGPDGPCDIDCQGGKKQTCSKAGVFTCNRDCPK